MKALPLALFASCLIASAAPPPPMPAVANAFTTNKPPNAVSNTVPILQNDFIAITPPISGAITNEWGNELVTQLIGGLIAATNTINGALNAAAFGARIDGFTDDHSIVQGALDMIGQAGGGAFFFPSGTCKLNQDLIIPDNVYLYGTYGSVLDFTDATITNSCILVQGSLTELPALASQVPIHSTAITLASAHNLSANDVVVLWNTNEFSYSPYRSYYYDGEFCLVRVASGSSLTFSAPTYASYEVADTRLYKLNGVRTRISSLNILGKNGGQVPVIKVLYGRDFALDNLELSGSEYTQILLSHSYGGVVNKCNAVDYSTGAGINYGALAGNSQRIIFSGNQFLTTRHGLSFGGNDTTASVPCRQLIVDANIIGSVGNIYGLNLHGNCSDFTISDNDLPNGMECPDRGVVIGNRIRASNNNRYAFTDNAELIGNDIRFEGNDVEAVSQFNEGLVKWTSVSNCAPYGASSFVNNTIRTWNYSRSTYPSDPTDVLRVTVASGGQTNWWPSILNNKFWTTIATVGDYYFIRLLTASTNAGFVGATIEGNEMWGAGIGADANVKYGNINANQIHSSIGAGIDVRFNANPQMTNQIWNVNDNLVTLANKAGVKMTPDAQAEVYAHRNTLRNNARTHVGSNLDTGFYVGQGYLVDFEWNKLMGSSPQTNLYTLAATTVIHRNNIELGMTDRVVSATTNLTFSGAQIAFQHPALGLRGDSVFNWFTDTDTFAIGNGIGAGISGYRIIVNDSDNSTRRVLFANDAALGQTAAAFSFDMRVGGGVTGPSGFISINPIDFAADANKQARLNIGVNSTAANGIGFHIPIAGQKIDFFAQGTRHMRFDDNGVLLIGNGSGTNVIAFLNAAETFGFYLDGYNGSTGDTTLTNTFGGGTGYKLSSGAHNFYGNGGLSGRIASASGYTGSGTKALYDDGTYKTNSAITINATDGYLPYRSSATAFGDSPWYRIGATEMGFGSTARFLLNGNGALSLGEGAAANINSVGGQNTVFGNNALQEATTGFANTALGESAAENLTGSRNVAIGREALTSSGNVSDNVAVGDQAAAGSSTSTESTAVGAQAGYGASGNEQVYVGAYAGMNTSGNHTVYVGAHTGEGVAGVTNAVAIGWKAKAPASNTAQIGTNGVTVLYLNGTVGWYRGTGTPESAVTATVGSFYSREDGGAGTSFYVKESGTGNTGWVGK